MAAAPAWIELKNGKATNKANNALAARRVLSESESKADRCHMLSLGVIDGF